MLSYINQTERDKLYYMLYVESNKAKHVEIGVDQWLAGASG